MDFSLTTLFVANTGTLASTGGTQDLAPGQIGIFRNDYTFANAGNIAAAPYFYIASGRPSTGVLGVGSKRSDKISAPYVIDWYKSVAEDTATNQITTLGNFNVKCGDEVNITFRVHSKLVEMVYYYGLTHSVTVQAPCCDCGEIPCDNIDATNTQALVDEAVTKLRADEKLSAYLTFDRTGSGATSAIRIEGKPVTQITNATDVAAQQLYYDRVWFRAFAYTGAPTTQDYQFVEDVCEGVTAVATVTQRATYRHGTSAEVRQIEMETFAYQTPVFKALFRNPGYNGANPSEVVDGTYYDLYYLKVRDYKDQQTTWASYVNQDFTVIVAFPTGQGSAFETVMTAALGAPKNYSGVDVPATTTTTSTSSTTTTTTSTLTP